MAALKRIVRIASTVAPRPAAVVAERLWFRPRARHEAAPPAGAKPFEMSIAKRQLHGFTLGDGPPVLMLHGWGGATSDLSRLAEAVAAAGGMAVVPNLPGHGADRGHRTDLFMMSAAVSAVTWRFGMPDVVVAHSFGAPVAFTAFAAGGPRRTILIAPAVRMDRYVRFFSTTLGLSDRAATLLERRIELFAGPQILSIMRGEGRIPGSGVLVVHDPQDRRTPFADSQAYVGSHPDARLVEVDGAGHQGILSHPDTLAAVAGEVESIILTRR